MSNVCTDTRGRKITFRELDPGDQLDLFEACGKNSSNPAWLSTALVVCSVSAIDGVPVMMPRNPDEVKKAARILGNDGISAVTAAMTASAPADAPAAGLNVDVAKN